jgi:NAD(P)-dependent dehydrogenase (short-subunit alcohol dehydrogenase family)
MTHVPYDDSLLNNLNGKVCIITGLPTHSGKLTSGGAQGIGAAAVEIFVNASAKVVFADMNTTGGKATEEKVKGYQHQSHFSSYS